MKKIFLLSLFFVFFLFSHTSAQLSQENKIIFERFSRLLEQRFTELEQQALYKRLTSEIQIILEKRNIETLRKERLEDIRDLSYETLYQKDIESDASSNSQRIIELKMRNSWENTSWYIPYSQLQTEFQYFITDKRKFIETLEKIEGIYFSNYIYFPNEYGLREQDLASNSLSRSLSPLYRDDSGRYNFVRDFEKKTILQEDIFFGLPEKFELMQYLYDDMRFTSKNPEQTLREIQEVTKNITTWKSKSQKIEIIYNYILEHLAYSENFQLDDMYIYSGLEAFKRKSAVCTWYVKLMAYMLAFAGIDDFEVIRWYVIDADDFPQIGHAWIRIGDRYYDPTFDDPLWNTQALTRGEYKYFVLPRDIMYTNRFEYGTLPENLRSASMTERKNLIRAELVKLYPKYQARASEFRVFDEIAFREKYNLSQTLPLTLPRLTSVLPFISVNAEDFRYTESGATRQIQSLNFFTLTDQNLSSLLEQVRYNFSEYQLMRWNLPNGTHEWRLGFNMVVR